jgi:hypothetical protein
MTRQNPLESERIRSWCLCHIANETLRRPSTDTARVLVRIDLFFAHDSRLYVVVTGLVGDWIQLVLHYSHPQMYRTRGLVQLTCCCYAHTCRPIVVKIVSGLRRQAGESRDQESIGRVAPLVVQCHVAL